MTMVLKNWRERKLEPISLLEWVLVTVSVVQGLYVFSPLYRWSVKTNGKTPFVEALNHPTVTYFYIAFIIISALVLAGGIVKKSPRIRALGLFFQLMLRTYNLFVTLLVVGLFPLTWIYPFTIVLFCLVLWGNASAGVNRRA